MRISNFQFVQILWDLQLTNMGFLQLCQQRLVPKYNLKVQVKELLIKVLHHIIFHFKVYLIKTKTGILDVITVIDVKNFFLFSWNALPINELVTRKCCNPRMILKRLGSGWIEDFSVTLKKLSCLKWRK